MQGLAPEEAAALLAAASDITLVLDPAGVIEDLSSNLADLPAVDVADWVGRPWVDIVTPESRTKVQSLLQEAGARNSRRWRHVNHPGAAGSDFPVMYAAVPMGSSGRVLAMGRDVRGLAELQQRLVDAQHALERDYWRLRHVETRYQLLFESVSEAILVVDGASGKVLDANPAAKDVLGQPVKRLVGQVFGAGLPDRARRELAALLGRVRASGRSEDVVVRVGAPLRTELRVSASLFVQDDKPLYLLRLRGADGDAGAALPRPSLSQVVDRLPDGFVLTDPDGRVLSANGAFVELAQMAAEDQLLGETVDRWLGRPGVDLQVMLATLRQQGALRLFGTVVHGEHGVDAEVEVSAVAVPDAEPPCLGFSVRHVGRRIGPALQGGKAAPRSVEQLTQLVGRMPLKDLVRESTDLIEQLCIEAALQLTQGNRASAAEMLGLSRQSLYVKLHRYGMAETGVSDVR
jgi:transcriptional regulator PpsR